MTEKNKGFEEIKIKFPKIYVRNQTTDLGIREHHAGKTQKQKTKAKNYTLAFHTQTAEIKTWKKPEEKHITYSGTKIITSDFSKPMLEKESGVKYSKC